MCVHVCVCFDVIDKVNVPTVHCVVPIVSAAVRLRNWRSVMCLNVSIFGRWKASVMPTTVVLVLVLVLLVVVVTFFEKCLRLC